MEALWLDSPHSNCIGTLFARGKKTEITNTHSLGLQTASKENKICKLTIENFSQVVNVSTELGL